MGEKCIIDPARDCLGLAKAEMLEKQMDEYRRQARETHSQLFDRIRELERAESARGEQYKQIMEKLDQLLEWQETQQKSRRPLWMTSRARSFGQFWRLSLRLFWAGLACNLKGDTYGYQCYCGSLQG